MKRENLRKVSIKYPSGEIKLGVFHEWSVVSFQQIPQSKLYGIVEVETGNGFGKAILVPTECILFMDNTEEE